MPTAPGLGLSRRGPQTHGMPLMLDNANDVQTSRNERSNSCFAELDRLLVDPKYGAAELARLREQSKHALDWAAPFNYRRTRPIIVDWLVKAFDTMGLRDEWLVNCICLLDRISSQRAAQENGLKQKEKSISLQKDWKKKCSWSPSVPCSWP